jgi:hypothetical protein
MVIVLCLVGVGGEIFAFSCCVVLAVFGMN